MLLNDFAASDADFVVSDSDFATPDSNFGGYDADCAVSHSDVAASPAEFDASDGDYAASQSDAAPFMLILLLSYEFSSSFVDSAASDAGMTTKTGGWPCTALWAQ